LSAYAIATASSRLPRDCEAAVLTTIASAPIAQAF
jgi:hypothetical protein